MLRKCIGKNENFFRTFTLITPQIYNLIFFLIFNVFPIFEGRLLSELLLESFSSFFFLFFPLFFLKQRFVDDEHGSVFDFSFVDLLDDFVDLRDGEELTLGKDLVEGGEIDHVDVLREAGTGASNDGALIDNESHETNWGGGKSCKSHDDELAMRPEGGHQERQVDIGATGGEHEIIEEDGEGLDAVRIGGVDVMMGTQLEAFGLFCGATGERGHSTAVTAGEFDGEMSKATDANDTNVLTGENVVKSKWGESGSTGAEKRTGELRRNCIGNWYRVTRVDSNVFRKTSASAFHEHQLLLGA